MFVFGHLGWGSALAKPAVGRKRALSRFLLLGTLLPDLIDKPLFYIFGDRDGFLSGTRLFGHAMIGVTLLFMMKRKWGEPLLLLAIGMATHLTLDLASDSLRGNAFGERGVLHAILWPALGWAFPRYPFEGIGGHWGSLKDPVILFFEATGAILLVLSRRRLTKSVER